MESILRYGEWLGTPDGRSLPPIFVDHRCPANSQTRALSQMGLLSDASRMSLRDIVPHLICHSSKSIENDSHAELTEPVEFASLRSFRSPRDSEVLSIWSKAKLTRSRISITETEFLKYIEPRGILSDCSMKGVSTRTRITTNGKITRQSPRRTAGAQVSEW